MYRLIIAEDDENIRTGLTQLIDWNDLGFEVSAAFADGASALAYLQNKDAEVLLTDIRMQTLSGIALTKALRDVGSDIRVVFISGYRDFQYATAAIDQNVEASLLTPLTLDALYAAFSRSRQSLDARRADTPGLSPEQASYLAGRVLHDLLIGRFSNEGELTAKLKSLGLSQPFAPGFLLLLRPTQAGLDPADQQILWDTTEGSLLSLPVFARNAICVLPREGLQILLVYGGETASLIACHTYCRDKLAAALQRLVGHEYHLGVGDLTLNALHLPAAFRTLHQTLQNQSLYPPADLPQHRDAARVAAQAKQYMDAHYTRPMALHEVAAQVFLSPAYFSRLFKAIAGESYVQYLTRIRMDAAKRLLEQGELPVWRVAEAVGYPSQKYFSRIFKATTGLSPSEYQEGTR